MVPHARYIVYDAVAGRPYLVVLDAGSSSKKYYSFTVTGTGLAEKISALTAVGSLPAGVDSARSYAEERQNFANWFTYHRRREFLAKNALANVIRSLSGVKVGIYGINKRVVVPLSYVNVTQNFTVLDSTNTLLQNLYAYYSSGGTPLKSGLKTVGQFYHRQHRHALQPDRPEALPHGRGGRVLPAVVHHHPDRRVLRRPLHHPGRQHRRRQRSPLRGHAFEHPGGHRHVLLRE